uniref:DNA/RNA-binding protein Alba-like domain-containing protein n=1 Tax=Glossina brevipalpis TaxID=37001 RepID=A0A1A9W0Z8_9MUSC
MMHYRKGENIEKAITKSELPFKDCIPIEKDFLWMHVNGGTKVNNVITYAKNALDKGEHRIVIWSGQGGGVVKTVSCAEILKRSYPLYQVTRICYATVEEHWLPQMEGLEEIVAVRQIPSIHILMSLDAINDTVHDVQNPNTKGDIWFEEGNNAPSTSRGYNQMQRNDGNEQRRPHQNRRRPKPQNTRQQLTSKSENNPQTNDNTSPSDTNQSRQQTKPQKKKSDNSNQQKPKFRKPHNQTKPNVSAECANESIDM